MENPEHEKPSAHLRLNGNDRRPIRLRKDDNFIFVSKMAETFESMGGGEGMSRQQKLTSNNSAAFCVTFRGICGIAKYLLSIARIYCQGLFKMMNLKVNSVYRGMSGSSYFISVNQILASARLRQMKLFHSLQIAT